MTPLKPPTKDSISAEAINASLYYLHVSSPEDELVLQSIEQELGEKILQNSTEHNGEQETPHNTPKPEEFVKLNHVKRKPVGGSSQSAPPPVPPPHREPVSTTPDEKVVPDVPPLPPRPIQTSIVDNALQGSEPFPSASAEEKVPGPRGQDDAGRPPLPRRPLPSVPGNDMQPSPITPSEASRNPKRWSAQAIRFHEPSPTACREHYDNPLGGRYSLDASRPVLRTSSLRNRPSLRRKGFPLKWPQQSPTTTIESFESTENTPNPGFHVTLIRRDPTHGLQWNVGTISNSGVDINTIDLEISTPGYGRFAGHNTPLSLEALGLSSPATTRQRGASVSSLRPSTSHGSEVRNDAHEGANSKTFHRKLFVSAPPGQRSQHSRDNSKESIELSNNANGSPPKSASSRLKSGYYTFTSPWNGTCTFVTSINGRSLKCKHMIPGPAAGENPAATVAEIRFNIPLTAGHPHHHFNPNQQSPFSLSQLAALSQRDGGKRSSLSLLLNPNTYRGHTHTLGSGSDAVFNIPKFSRARSHSDSSTDADETASPNVPDRDIDDEDRLDLSLAHERAGGGLRGKSAKLGKLIVEDEGQKMLDLLVAACMGVWWRAYYHE